MKRQIVHPPTGIRPEDAAFAIHEERCLGRNGFGHGLQKVTVISLHDISAHCLFSLAYRNSAGSRNGEYDCAYFFVAIGLAWYIVGYDHDARVIAMSQITNNSEERRTIPMSPRTLAGLPPRFNISRAVADGDWLFIGGQMDSGSGDLMSQTVRCMRSVYELIARTNHTLGELAQLQFWYLAGSVQDEASYRAEILREFPECSDKLMILTAVPSFLARGFEVEIDAIAIAGPQAAVRSNSGLVNGVRRGHWVLANCRVQRTGEALLNELFGTLAKLDTPPENICRLYAAFPQDLDAAERREIEAQLSRAFQPYPPAFHSVLLPRTSKDHFSVELEVIANTNPAASVQRFGRATSSSGHSDWAFANVVLQDGVAFCSGQYPIDQCGQVVHKGDSAEQARVIMARLGATLNLCGAHMADLAKIKTYYSSEWSRVNWERNLQARMESLSNPGPAAAGLDGLVPTMTDALLSVDGIAVFRS